MEKALVDEFIEYRIYPCRYCHGGGQRQYTPLEYLDAKTKHDQKRARLMASGKADPGQFPAAGTWFDHRKPPNPECPKCNGIGETKTAIRDTRKLSPRAKAAFAGVRMTKNGPVALFRENGIAREVRGQ